jgi:hypothetical protein
VVSTLSSNPYANIGSQRGAVVTSSSPRLSGVRTLLLVGLAVVWLGEGLMTGLQPLAEGWTKFWKMFPPDDPTLAAALYITHAFEAPLKAGLLVLALSALASGKPSVRTPLFVSMSLVPPINIAFHFRAQGFPPVSMTIATTLSAILWGSFLLTSEPTEPSEPKETGRRDLFGVAWCGFSAVALTFLGLLFLLVPTTALYWEFPCLSSTFDAHQTELQSLTVSVLAAGSHLTALATAGWFATAGSRTNRTLRQAITLSGITVAALMCALPLRQVVQHRGWTCARSPVVLLFVLLLVGWVAYAAVSRSRGDV